MCNCEEDWSFFWGKRYKTVLGLFDQFKVQFCVVLPVVIALAVVFFIDVRFIIIGFLLFLFINLSDLGNLLIDVNKMLGKV